MAYREVGVFEVKEILRLYWAGVPKKAVSRTVGPDIKTVRRYTSAADELGLQPPLDDAKLAQLFAFLQQGKERERGQAYRTCQEKSEPIKKWLDGGVRLTKVRKLLKRIHRVDVPYSTLHRFAVAELGFGRRGRRSVRSVDAPPGQELQIDTGWVVTLTVGQKQVRKKAFIFTPNLSRYRFVFPIESETTTAAIEACEAAWSFYGGVFEVLLPDNTKAIVEKASATSPLINEVFQEYAQERGFTVDPARVRKPKDKARVERTVAFVRDDCFGGEVLGSIEAARVRALFRATRARLEPDMLLERWDDTADVSFDQAVLSELVSLSFIDEGHHVAIVGPVGVGKTFIAHAIGHIACRRGISVLVVTVDAVLKALRHSRLDNSFEAEMRKLIAADLLILDDFALDAMDSTESRDISELLTERHRAGSVIVTSNRGPDEWLATFADPVRAQSTIDRFANKAYDLVMEGESYRPRLKPTVKKHRGGGHRKN